MADNQVTEDDIVMTDEEIVKDSVDIDDNTNMKSSDVVTEDSEVGLADSAKNVQLNSDNYMPEDDSNSADTETNGEAKSDEIV